jgi:hypothetical protein
MWLNPPCPGTAQLKIIPSFACLNILSKYTARRQAYLGSEVILMFTLGTNRNQ